MTTPAALPTAAMVDVQFQGRWGTALAIDTAWEGAGEDVVEWANALDLSLAYAWSPRARARLEVQFRHWSGGQERPGGPNFLFNAVNPRAEYVARVGEAYVAWRWDQWSLRLGNLTTPWGSTDIMRPGDVVNPRDLQGLGAAGQGASGRLMPQLTAEGAYTGGAGWTATVLVVPFFVPDRVTVFGRDVGIASNPSSPLAQRVPLTTLADAALSRSSYEELQPLLTNPTYPDEVPKHLSAGLRLTATRWNTDFGLGYFFGWDRTLWLELDEDVQELLGIVAADGRLFEEGDVFRFIGRNPQVLPLLNSITGKQQQGQRLANVEVMRRHSVVLDIARYIGPIGARLDLAWSPAQNFIDDQLRTIRRPSLFGALGLSYERVDGDRPLAITVEGFWQEIMSHDAAMTRAFVPGERRGDASADPIITGRRWAGLAGGLSWRLPVADLDVQAGGVWGITTGDVIVNASLARQWDGWLTTTLSFALFEGPPLDERITAGGLFDRNDQLTLGVSGAF